MCVCVCVYAHAHVCECVCACVYVCVRVGVGVFTPRLLITSSMMWTAYDWLNKLYSFYTGAVVSIIINLGMALELKHVIEIDLITLS